MTVIIAGAGMAGLLTAHMLRRHDPLVMEAQPTLPNNHAALLRFRTEAVSAATNIPFRRVRVTKGLYTAKDGVRNVVTLRDANQYALKVTSELMARSILDLSPSERFIAPPDFIAQLARGLNIQYNSPLTPERLGLGPDGLGGDPDIISTIPMPLLMKMVAWPERPDFKWRPIWSQTLTLQTPSTDLYQTLYYPEEEFDFYRASFTGSQLILEYTREPSLDFPEEDLGEVARHFGIDLERCTYEIGEPSRQEYGKLVPLPDEVRKSFIIAMTDMYRVYSVGRFATWRQILLDDVVRDVQMVDQMLTQRSTYTRRLQGAKETR